MLSVFFGTAKAKRIKSSLLWVALAWSPIVAGADQEYVVKRNDTLSAIAQRYDTTVSELAAHNHLIEPDKIIVGQKLRIPQGHLHLDSTLENTLNAISVQPHKWEYIVIHHSGSESGNAEIFDRYHRNERRMENGLAYHFIIGNGRGMGDGEIEIGNRWNRQLDGGHLASLRLNRKSIGICLVGNFDNTSPTGKQMESLEALVRYLMRQCRLETDAVQTHQQINTVHTRCPGKHFPKTEFRADLR